MVRVSWWAFAVALHSSLLLVLLLTVHGYKINRSALSWKVRALDEKKPYTDRRNPDIITLFGCAKSQPPSSDGQGSTSGDGDGDETLKAEKAEQMMESRPCDETGLKVRVIVNRTSETIQSVVQVGKGSLATSGVLFQSLSLITGGNLEHMHEIILFCPSLVSPLSSSQGGRRHLGDSSKSFSTLTFDRKKRKLSSNASRLFRRRLAIDREKICAVSQPTASSATTFPTSSDSAVEYAVRGEYVPGLTFQTFWQWLSNGSFSSSMQYTYQRPGSASVDSFLLYAPMLFVARQEAETKNINVPATFSDFLSSPGKVSIEATMILSLNLGWQTMALEVDWTLPKRKSSPGSLLDAPKLLPAFIDLLEEEIGKVIRMDIRLGASGIQGPLISTVCADPEIFGASSQSSNSSLSQVRRCQSPQVFVIKSTSSSSSTGAAEPGQKVVIVQEGVQIVSQANLTLTDFYIDLITYAPAYSVTLYSSKYLGGYMRGQFLGVAVGDSDGSNTSLPLGSPQITDIRLSTASPFAKTPNADGNALATNATESGSAFALSDRWRTATCGVLPVKKDCNGRLSLYLQGPSFLPASPFPPQGTASPTTASPSSSSSPEEVCGPNAEMITEKITDERSLFVCLHCDAADNTPRAVSSPPCLLCGTKPICGTVDVMSSSLLTLLLSSPSSTTGKSNTSTSNSSRRSLDIANPDPSTLSVESGRALLSVSPDQIYCLHRREIAPSMCLGLHFLPADISEFLTTQEAKKPNTGFIIWMSICAGCLLLLLPAAYGFYVAYRNKKKRQQELEAEKASATGSRTASTAITTNVSRPTEEVERGNTEERAAEGQREHKMESVDLVSPSISETPYRPFPYAKFSPVAGRRERERFSRMPPLPSSRLNMRSPYLSSSEESEDGQDEEESSEEEEEEERAGDELVTKNTL